MVQIENINTLTLRSSDVWRNYSDFARTAAIIEAWPLSASFVFHFIAVKGTSVIVRPIHIIESGELGELVRLLEKALRTALCEPLEVFCEERKDENKPRDPIHRKRIIDWLRNRMNLKQQAVDEK